MSAAENITALQALTASLAEGIDVAWILTCSALVVIMQVGFAYVEAGNVRVKNVRSILLKNTVDYVIGGLAYVFIASGFARGKSAGGFIGTDGFGGTKPDAETANDAYYYSVTLYSALFACTTSTIISGAIAERMRLSAYMILSLLSPFFLYSLPAHWIWNADGFLNSSDEPKLAVSDFAGGGVVHVTGGVAAYVAAWFVGPRIGRFNSNTGKDRDIDGHSVVLGGLGSWLILFGWLGFNAGSSMGLSTPETADAAALAAINTFLAVLVGALVSILYHVLVLGKLNLGEMYNNMLAGAASITAGCGFVSVYSAVVIAVISSLAYIISGPYFRKRLRIDDPLNAISVHFSAASVGFILLGVFHKDDGLIAENGSSDKLIAQCIGILVIMVNAVFWTASALLIFTIVVGPVRVEESIEVKGCDIELDGIAAYETSEVHITYHTLCEDAELLSHFTKFLQSIYCHNNMLFLEAVESYEKGLKDPAVDSQADAQAIFDNFVCPDGNDPINLPDWLVNQVQVNLAKGSTALQDLFGPSKQEIHNTLDMTISNHFSHTEAYLRYSKASKKSKNVAPLHWLNRLYCCTNGKSYKYGRAKPFDPFKKFRHTERIVESEDEDEESMIGRNVVAPVYEEESDED